METEKKARFRAEKSMVKNKAYRKVYHEVMNNHRFYVCDIEKEYDVTILPGNTFYSDAMNVKPITALFIKTLKKNSCHYSSKLSKVSC